MRIINQVKLNINHTFDDLVDEVTRISHIKREKLDLKKFKILKKSIDARDKKNIKYVYNVAIDYIDDNKFNPIIEKSEFQTISLKNDIRPIVVGFGPSGIFASYVLVLNGIKPIIIERGKSLEEREYDVKKFFDTLCLDENSNVCFGEGGAGAFSDGKLNTNNKDKTGVYKFILETFVKFGASEEILYENLPHIGTDKLTGVIKNIRNEIIRLGGEIRYSEKFTYDKYKDFAKNGTPIILAIGNSSRDTFRDLINNGFDIKPKAIAIGFRVAHRQKLINDIQYGENAKNLPPATYKLTYDVGNGHSVYSFCMCPGGYIINSSNFNGFLSINGMSYHDRAGLYSNSAIVETISIDDVNCFKEIKPDMMINLQEIIEKKAYELEKGYIPYCYSEDVNMTKNSNLNEKDIFKGLAKYNSRIFDIYEDIGLKFSIKNDVIKALKHFNKIMPGFYNFCDNSNKETCDFSDMIIAGVETRTSSPVTLDRNDNFMCNVENFYPCGEGLGHGGGIMSSAADGVNVALRIIGYIRSDEDYTLTKN